MSQIILVTSGRGGAGKSIVCAGLGTALAACGKSVLLLEGARRSFDVLFGVQERVVFDLSDALSRRCELAEAVIPAGGLWLICAPADGAAQVSESLCIELVGALRTRFDFILIEVDGEDQARLTAYAPCADRAVIVAAPDRISARACRTVSDTLAAEISDIRLCVTPLPADFSRTRPIPDLDWLIDTVCAQLIAVLPFDSLLVAPQSIGQMLRLSNFLKTIFDNFAQRIIGNYIDLLVQ